MSEVEPTEPKVFIIESLDFEEEEEELFEGRIISKILELSKVESKYYYVRTKQEFVKVIELFNQSNYRYLHISCHGGDNCIWTTLDKISFQELAYILQPFLFHKRLFLSACSVVNKELARCIIPTSNCYSIIGPLEDIGFDDAAIMWSSFYHLMFKLDSEKMQRAGLIKNLQKVVSAFDQSLCYYSISESLGIKEKIIKN